MDDVQTAFVTHYPSYGFDLDMMKVCDGKKNSHSTDSLIPPHQRSMESVGGPDAKQACWLPTSLNGTTGTLSTNSSGGMTNQLCQRL